MVDHIRTLLLNPSGRTDYRKVHDAPSDKVMSLFGVSGGASDERAVDSVMPLAEAPDLVRFRRFFDTRTTPRAGVSVYSSSSEELSQAGLYDKVLGQGGWWHVSSLFSAGEQTVRDNLMEMRAAARSMDAPYALGAVLLACAYRRMLLQSPGGL